MRRLRRVRQALAAGLRSTECSFAMDDGAVFLYYDFGDQGFEPPVRFAVPNW